MRTAPENDLSEQTRRLCALFAHFSAEEPEMRRKANDERQFQAFIEPYAAYFELPFEVFVVIFLVCLDLVDTITELSGDDETQEVAMTSVAVSDTRMGATKAALENNDMKVIIGVLWATLSQIHALNLFGICLTDLIDRAREGDTLALFRAISIDRSVVACPTVARRIALAETQGDEEFMDQLARTIRRKTPARPVSVQHNLHLVLDLLLARTYPQPLTKKRIAEMLAAGAGLFSPTTDDSYAALQQLIDRQRHRLER